MSVKIPNNNPDVPVVVARSVEPSVPTINQPVTTIYVTQSYHDPCSNQHELISIIIFALGWFIPFVHWSGACLYCQKDKQTPLSRSLNICSIVLAYIGTIGIILGVILRVVPLDGTLVTTDPGYTDPGYTDPGSHNECESSWSCDQGYYCSADETLFKSCNLCPSSNQTCEDIYGIDIGMEGSNEWECNVYCEGWCDISGTSTDTCGYTNSFWRGSNSESNEAFGSLTFCGSSAKCQLCPDLLANETCDNVTTNESLVSCNDRCHPCLEYDSYDSDCCAIVPGGCLDGYEYSYGDICYEGWDEMHMKQFVLKFNLYHIKIKYKLIYF